MSDALISPEVGIVSAVIAVGCLAVAVKKVKGTVNLPLMGIMGAFIFAAQMINFSIPGTGSSGHIVGGILLAAVLGPWGGCIALSSVLIIQCLLFADGGFLALGCNILNLAVISCLIVYPLVYKPLIHKVASLGKIMWVSILACVVGLELGALAVTLETAASGITALPFSQFLLIMLSIHLAIGVIEGVATAAVIFALQKNRSDLLSYVRVEQETKKRKVSGVLIALVAVTFVLAASFTWIASSNPDGLEWSIQRITGVEELAPSTTAGIYSAAANIQQTTALMPDYSTTFAGIIGSALIIVIAFGVSRLYQSHRRKYEE